MKPVEVMEAFYVLISICNIIKNALYVIIHHGLDQANHK